MAYKNLSFGTIFKLFAGTNKGNDSAGCQRMPSTGNGWVSGGCAYPPWPIITFLQGSEKKSTEGRDNARYFRSVGLSSYQRDPADAEDAGIKPRTGKDAVPRRVNRRPIATNRLIDQYWSTNPTNRLIGAAVRLDLQVLFEFETVLVLGIDGLVEKG